MNFTDFAQILHNSLLFNILAHYTDISLELYKT